MFKKYLNFRVLLIIAVILIAGIAAFFILTRDDIDKKQVKGVFVINERGERV